VHAAAVVGELANSFHSFLLPPDPIGFRTSTRDVEAQSAAKEHTSEKMTSVQVQKVVLDDQIDAKVKKISVRVEKNEIGAGHSH